jgi:hypothetical protein
MDSPGAGWWDPTTLCHNLLGNSLFEGIYTMIKHYAPLRHSMAQKCDLLPFNEYIAKSILKDVRHWADTQLLQPRLDDI